MGRGLTYADAVRVLGGSDRTVSALDRVTGGLLLAASAAGAGFALGLFDPAAHLARLSGGLITGIRERLTGLGRFDRAERLAAAHAIMVMAAFFEQLPAGPLPFDVRELELTRPDQLRLATGEDEPGASIADLGRALLRREIPCPAPQRPYEVTLEAIDDFYGGLAASIGRYVEGLAVWDRLNDTQRGITRKVLAGHRLTAVRRYEQLFRQLAVEVPEVAFWANAVDHQATRAQIRRLSHSLAGLSHALEEMAVGRAPDDRRAALARSHRAALGRPILAPDEAPAGVHVPSLEQLYVNPSFRVAHGVVAEALASDSFWRREPVREDLQSFLVGFLTAPGATDAPLLVLGQPGSGKSALSRVLAARLPATDFLAVAVSLREVPADTDLQTQIEYSVRSATGETLTWPELARSAGDAMPVVILDGFDELVQATGVTQSDYLEKVAAFQRREADQGRPTVVIVTSRTTVADRARSVDGMVAIRLEPFDDGQIEQWLRTWNGLNQDSLAARGLRTLPPGEVLAHRTLAAQPLLLMMLALHDADGNGLQRRTGTLAEFELYERLLAGYAVREVRKHGGTMPDDEFDRAVEHELIRLSVVAIAMFNRSRQWVTQAELDADLPALLGPDGPVAPAGMRVPLTAGQVAVSRFYFVHQSQAVRDGTTLRTYEFLHATFGEYLVARLVIRELQALADSARLNAARSRATVPDDDFLFALLSFAALTSRGSVVRFLRDGLADMTSAPLKQQLLGLFHRSLLARRSQAYEGYRPADLAVTGRHAAWSANLVLLAVLVGGEVTGDELFPDSTEKVGAWRRVCLLWRGQLSSEGWNGLVHGLDVVRDWDGDRRAIRVRACDDPTAPQLDLHWSYAGAGLSAAREKGLAKLRYYGFADLRRHSQFLCDRVDDTVMHLAEPFGDDPDGWVGTVHILPGGIMITAARALTEILLSDDDGLLEAYERALAVEASGTGQERFRAALARLLHADRERLPDNFAAHAMEWLAHPFGRHLPPKS